MRKIASSIFIFIGTALLVLSTCRPAMKYIMDKRALLPGWTGVHHPQGVGDLVSIAYLDNVKEFYAEKDYRFIKSPDTGNIDLYVYGDSYVREIPDSAFGSISHYHFGRRDYTDLTYTLQRRKKNILIIETAERFVRPYFQYLSIFDHVKQEAPALSFFGRGANYSTLSSFRKDADNPALSSFTKDADNSALSSFASGSDRMPRYALLGIKADLFFNPGINHNLEFNLFGYRFMDPVKLLKSTVTYRLFGRTSGDVTVSEDGKYLFLRETVAAHNPLSSYEPIGREELTQLTDHLNEIYDHYKKEGFDEVYLSIIPNPASILQPGYYNGLIPALHKTPALKMPVIDVYRPFSQSSDPGKLFRLGDSHWNNNGLQIWIQLVNQELKKQYLSEK